MFDPLEKSPPPGVELLVLSPGGRLQVSTWYKGCEAWALKPKIPPTVKARQSLIQLQHKESHE